MEHALTTPASLPVTCEIDGPLATITLNRPDKNNALSTDLRDQFVVHLDTILDIETVHVVIVTGAGSTFSAGFDLDEFKDAHQDGFADRMWTSSDAFHKRLLEYPLPTLAAVNGPALAGGFDLAVMCDLRIASDTSYFAHPEAAIGDVVYGPLRELIGGALARELCLTGRKVNVEEALRINLISEIAPPTTLLTAARTIAKNIARTPRELLMRTKHKIIRRANLKPGKTLDL